MMLPPALLEAIERALSGQPLGVIAERAAALSLRYRSGNAAVAQQAIAHESDTAAYVAARLPATYGAVRAVLAEAQARCPDFAPRRLLDAGSGPGTVLWAAADAWPELGQFTLLDSNPLFQACGCTLAAEHPSAAARDAEWRLAPLGTPGQGPEGSYDLVTAAYLLGELAVAAQSVAVAQLWQATGDMLVLVEPGTPAGYRRILAARDWLIGAGAHILAPCPHQAACPLSGEDWCHFAARIPRSRLQRLAKRASESFEDEKYSYLIASRAPAPAASARIIKPPQGGSGFVRFSVCTPTGFEEPRTISRRQGAWWRQVRKLEWGDILPDEGEG